MSPDPVATTDPEPTPAPGPDGRLTRLFRALGRLTEFGFALAALGQPTAWLLSRRFWLADLFSHFLEVGLFVSLLAALVTFTCRNRRVAAGLLVLAAVQAGAAGRYVWPSSVKPDPAQPARLKVLMANILEDNWSCDELAAFIRSENPDVVGLVEFTPLMQQGLALLARDFPYRVELPSGADGIALWFRRPPLSLDRPTFPVPGRNAILHGTFEFAGKPRHVWVVHPTSPLARSRRWLGDNRELTALGRIIREAGGSGLVVGDFNSTDTSGHFRDLLRETGYHDSRQGFGRQRSWPTDFFYRIAIDHCLVSPDLAVTDRRIGPNIGSDHFPIVVELAPAAGSSRAIAAANASQSGD